MKRKGSTGNPRNLRSPPTFEPWLRLRFRGGCVVTQSTSAAVSNLHTVHGRRDYMHARKINGLARRHDPTSERNTSWYSTRKLLRFEIIEMLLAVLVINLLCDLL